MEKAENNNKPEDTQDVALCHNCLMENKETEQKHQCVSCGQWFDECDIIGEVCADCHVTVIDDEDEL